MDESIMRPLIPSIAHGLNRGLWGPFRIYTQNHFNGFPEGARKKLTARPQISVVSYRW